MVDKALGKLDKAVKKVTDQVKEGQTDDAPVDLPGTFVNRDKDTDEKTHKEHVDTGRHDDIPSPGSDRT